MHEHSAVCMQHWLLVGSVVSALVTLIGSLFGSQEWYYWITMGATLITTPLAITASVTLRRRYLWAFIALITVELMLKVIFITNYGFIKRSERERCTNLEEDTPPDDCRAWRYNDLNFTNAIIFHAGGFIMGTTFLIFAVQLLAFIRNDWLKDDHEGTQNAEGVNSISLSLCYNSYAYGTFERDQATDETRQSQYNRICFSL